MAGDSSPGRRWFEEYVERIDAGVMRSPQDGVRYRCPCCRYPTLDERGGYEICELCGWEDDGQDDPHADEVWGGPNGLYSLSEARSNFKKYLTQYDPAKEPERDVLPGPVEREAKRALMRAFDELSKQALATPDDEAWEKVYECEKALANATGIPWP